MRNLDTVGTPARIGPFRILRRLGAGGMAEAFEAVREGPGGFVQRVCIKRVLPALEGSGELARLFLREARLAASLSHRNITSVVDFGQDRGTHYLALELVEGMDLRALLKRMPGRRLPVQVAVLVATEIAEALEHAHSRPGPSGTVVHQDVSPANILVSVDGDVKLTDFGISKALGDANLTRSDMVRGNVWYMAPELLQQSGAASPRADLYSLGVVLYQALSGRRPYDVRTQGAAMLAATKGERIHLRAAARDLPEPVYMVVERLMALDPEDRFPSARALIESLAPLTQESSARLALRELVREARQERKPEPPTDEATLVDIDVSEPSSKVDSRRWKKHARGPRAWQALSPSRPAPSREDVEAGTPSTPSDWKLGALAVLLGTVATFCVAAWAAL